MNFEDIDGTGYTALDADHIDTAFQALEDTVSGTESLTYSQRYLFAVLQASDSITVAESRAGNESFFGAVGNGIKAVWDYIMKMFKGIWNFFFGSGDDSVAKKEAKVEKQVDDDIEAMKKFDKEREQRKKERESELAADDAERKKKNDEKNAQYEKETQAWDQKVQQRREERLEFHSKMQTANDALTILIKANEAEPEKGVVFEKVKDELAIYLKKIDSVGRTEVIEKAGEITNVIGAIEVGVQIQRHIKDLKTARQPIVGLKNQVSGSVKQLEDKLKEIPKKNGYERDTVNKELKTAKAFMQTMVGLEKYLSETLDICGKFSHWLKVTYNI